MKSNGVKLVIEHTICGMFKAREYHRIEKKREREERLLKKMKKNVFIVFYYPLVILDNKAKEIALLL